MTTKTTQGNEMCHRTTRINLTVDIKIREHQNKTR